MSGISFVMYTQKKDRYQVQSTFITGIIITAVAAASVIYSIQSWSLFKQSIVHFLIMIVTVLPCLLVSDWFPKKNATDILKIFGIFLTAAIILWTTTYFVFSYILS
ncbi:DUF3021 family protein [Listeria monocytogenes]|nr:DUF3021 family protein [Listeria monocytogenes]